MLSRVFHVSEEPGIARFEPRPVPSLDAGVSGDAVWAVDEEHLANYLLPRDCPRVTYAAVASTSPDDRAKFGEGRGVAVEEAWRGRIEACALYLYELPPESFVCVDRGAGYHISRETVTPLRVTKFEDLGRALGERGIALKYFDDLWPLRDSVVSSTLEFSIIRFRNAKPREKT